MSRRLITVSGVFGLLLGYLFFGEDMDWALIPMLILAGVLIVSWVFQYQIDAWWIRKFPKRLDRLMRNALKTYSPFFARLSDEEQIEFERRVEEYAIAKDFIAQGIKSVPDDAKYIIAHYAVMLTWKKGDFLLSPYDRVVFYAHPFITPHYEDQVHIYEVEHVDGTMIFSLNHFMSGFRDMRKYYQTGLHCAAEVYLALYGAPPVPLPSDIWRTLEMISGASKERLIQYTGMAQEDPWPVIIHHAHSYEDMFKKTDPELYESVMQYLGR